MFDGTSELADENVELEMSWVHPMWARTGDASKSPAEKGPKIDQEKSKGQGKEAKSRVAGSGLDAHTT